MNEKVRNKYGDTSRVLDDRKLGDEWLDWDGSVDAHGSSKRGMFVGVAALAVVFIIAAVYAVFWLIEPRLLQISPIAYDIALWLAVAFCGIILLWLLLFTISSLAGVSIFGGVLIFPRLVNWLLSLAIKVGGVVGISRDRLVNSFMKVHNILLPGHRFLSPKDLMVLLPRCLQRDDFGYMRQLRDKYEFEMVTAGGGQEARKKIETSRPRAIIAVACERDLLSGFLEVNPRIPVIGLPITRPEGPCKNTMVNRSELESLLRKFIIVD